MHVLTQYSVHKMSWSQSICTFLNPLVPMQRQNECHTWWFELIQSVSASKRVTRSRRSSAWPIPFYGQLLTSQSGTVAGPHEESSRRGTEAICLCSGPVGRSHTVGTGRGKGQEGWRGRKEGKNKKWTHVIYVIANHLHLFALISVDKMVYFPISCLVRDVHHRTYSIKVKSLKEKVIIWWPCAVKVTF